MQSYVNKSQGKSVGKWIQVLNCLQGTAQIFENKTETLALIKITLPQSNDGVDHVPSNRMIYREWEEKTMDKKMGLHKDHTHVCWSEKYLFWSMHYVWLRHQEPE